MAWCRQPNNQTTKQPGDPRASLLLTTEKAVFCNPVNHLLSMNLPRWTVLRAARANPGSGPKRWQMGIFGSKNIVKARGSCPQPSHTSPLKKHELRWWKFEIVISLKIEQEVFQKIFTFECLSSQFPHYSVIISEPNKMMTC